MKILARLTLAALTAAGSLVPAFPAQAGLVMTISDSLGTAPVTVVGTQPGGPGTDFVATYSGSFGPVNLIISVGDSNSPTLSDPARIDTSVVVSGGTPATADVVTITVTDNGVTVPTGATAKVTSSAAANASGNASMTFQGSAAQTSTPLQTIPAGSISGSVVSAQIAGGLAAPYTMSATTTLSFAAGIVASANVDNIVEVTAPEPGSIVVWALVAGSVCVPALRRRSRFQGAG